MYYPVIRSAPFVPSTFWNPLDAYGVTLSHRNYKAVVNDHGGADNTRPHAAWDNVELTSGKWYWEVHIVECAGSGSTINLSFGLRNPQDACGRISANQELSNSYEARELRHNSDGGGSIETSTIGDIAVWHSNPGTAPFTVHDLIEVAGNYFACDITGVSGFTTGDVLMFALDRDAGSMWIGKNGTWFNSGDPAAGTNPQFTNMDCSEAQYGAVEVPWRFFFGTTGVTYSSSPLEFNLATGNNVFPQQYAAPSGFTALVEPSSIEWQGIFNNFRDSGSDLMSAGTGFNTCFVTPATIALNASQQHHISAGIMYLGEKYYWEVVPTTTGSTVYLGAAAFGAGDQNANVTFGTQCMWNQAGTLHDGDATITMDTTGVSGWDAAGTDTLMFALDLVAGKMWIGKNGTWFNSGDPAAGTNPQFSDIPLVYDWVCKGYIAANARQNTFLGSAFPFVYSAPSGFTSGVPLIEVYVP